MNKKILLGLFIILGFLLLISSNTFAWTAEGRNEFYTIELPEGYEYGNRYASSIGDITYIRFDDGQKRMTMYSFEKEEYDPDLNFNGLYTLDCLTQADLDKSVKEGAKWLSANSWSGYFPENDNVKVLRKELLTINGFPAQRVAYVYDQDDPENSSYYDAYAIIADNHIA